MLTAAGHSHWYTSGTFYAAAGAIAVVVIGFITVWATLFVGSTKRRLTYSLTDDTPLLATTTALARADVEVVYQGQRLDAPRVVSVRLVSQGRRDIASDDFDQERPLAIDLGVPIVKRLATESAPEIPESAIRVEGSKLMFGPCLIRKRQVMSFAFLVDGGRPQLSHEDYLLNVDVRQSAESGEWGIRQSLVTAASAVVVLGALWAASVTAWWLSAASNPVVAVPARVLVWLAPVWIVAVGFWFWRRRR